MLHFLLQKLLHTMALKGADEGSMTAALGS